VSEQIIKKSSNEGIIPKESQDLFKSLMSKEMLKQIKDKIDLNDPAFIKALKVYLADDKQNSG
jgi:hypothetical protein